MNLKYTKIKYSDFKFVQEVSAQITCYHNTIFMNKEKKFNFLFMPLKSRKRIKCTYKFYKKTVILKNGRIG